MSIADELRNEARAIQTFTCMAEQANRLLDIADRIDAEHERVCYDYQREFEDWKFVHDTEFVELPKDADGVPIHVGDVMESKDGVRFKVKFISLHKDVWMVNVAGWTPSKLRHHHAPTVEDVLREFAEGIKDQNADFTELTIAVYAAKLRLAEDGEGQQ